LIGAIAARRRRLAASGTDLPPAPCAWRLRGLPVCGSSETVLDRWLAADPRLAGEGSLEAPRAVIARRQRHGHGQRGRPWMAPPGGVWLSAALPWPKAWGTAASLGLATAVGLCLRLEARGLPVRIKWPNDLMLIPASGVGQGSRDGGGPLKLAGLLPRLRLRGCLCRWARIGVGLNVVNRVPPGAVALATVLGSGRIDPSHWCGEVLTALEWAMAWSARPEAVRGLAEERLLWTAGPIRLDERDWQPAGLTVDGGLRLACGPAERVIHRRFGTG
jgi:BirA family biotin operon repressor/biotin-[acetyl-CoA-carboxylase] ligase